MYARRSETLEELTTPHLRYNTPKPERITYKLPFVAASSLEDPHAPAWGPFFFVLYDNMIKTRPYRTRTFTYLQMTYQAPRSQICSQRPNNVIL